MELLSIKKRLQVIYLYFCGLSLDQIAAKLNISKGSVGNIVAELKAGCYPEAADATDQIETLRELSVNLAKLNLPVGQAVVGIGVLKRMGELGLSPSSMDRWEMLLASIKTQDDAQELIEAAYLVRDAQKETGLNLPALEEKVKQLGEQSKELDAVTAKVGEMEAELASLGAQMEKAAAELASTDAKYKWLLPRVQELEQREKALLARHEAMLLAEEQAKETLSILKTELKKLAKTGLFLEGLAQFNSKLQAVAKRHGLKASAVRERLLAELKQLDKGLGLETLVANQKQVLKDTRAAVAHINQEKVSLEAAVGDLLQQRQNLEAIIQATTNAVRLQIENLVPAANATVEQIAAALTAGCEAALSAVRQLREESIQSGRDIGQYEGVLRQSRWVEKFVALTHGEKDVVDPSDVRMIALLAINAVKAWLVQHQEGSPDIGLLAMNAATFLEEIEQWQPKA